MGTLKDRILFCGIWGHDQQIGASFHLQCCPLVSAGELRQCCPGLAASWLLRWNPGTSEGGLRQWSPEPVGFQLLVKIRFKKVFNSFQRKTYHSVSAIRRKKLRLLLNMHLIFFYAFLVQNKTLLLQFKKFTRNSDDYARNLKWSKLEGFEFGRTKPKLDRTFYFGIWFGFGSGYANFQIREKNRTKLFSR